MYILFDLFYDTVRQLFWILFMKLLHIAITSLSVYSVQNFIVHTSHSKDYQYAKMARTSDPTQYHTPDISIIGSEVLILESILKKLSLYLYKQPFPLLRELSLSSHRTF